VAGRSQGTRKDGSKFDVQVSANLVTDVDGNPICLMASFVDVTERKKLDQLKDEFIGLVSHELRTPLTVISGCLSTVLSEWNRLSSSEVQQLLKDALLESESLSYLIENLLELSRVQARQLTLYLEPIDVKTLVRKTLAKIKRQTTAHRFVTSIPDGLPLMNADPLRVERILYNLVDNAAKYSPPGSQIKVLAKAEPERLVIGVNDKGSGLSAH
jgi:K+-sensing histidine kinase KdpD